MSYLVTETMRRTYAAQRGVSQGAHITLTSTALGVAVCSLLAKQ